MTTLSDRVRAALTFSDEAFAETWQPEKQVDNYHMGMEEGAVWERKRTQALDAALADAVEALARAQKLIMRPISMTDGEGQLFEIEGICGEALTRIERALGGEK